MDLVGWWSKTFAKRQTIEGISTDELRQERIRLEQEENKLGKKIDDLEARKKQMFLQAVNETAERKRRNIASEIKALDVEASGADRNLRFFSHQRRVISGFIQIKDQERIMAEHGLISVINKMDLSTLQTYVEKATVNEAFSMEKLLATLTTLEEGRGLGKEVPPDKDVDQIMQAIEQARLQVADNPAAADEELKKLNQTLAAQDKMAEKQ
jgi:hypothetical protein